MAYIHGHAACVTSGCPMFGVNQAGCCEGETAETSPAETAEIAAIPIQRVAVPAGPPKRGAERPKKSGG
jgi:hypothetical protein